MKILVLGATGLLGNAMFRSMSTLSGARVTGTIRREAARQLFAPEHAAGLTVVEDIENLDAMTQEFLQNGGRIVQCPPGSSEAVVYKKGSFKRRQATKPAEAGAPTAPAAAGGTEGTEGS